MSYINGNNKNITSRNDIDIGKMENKYIGSCMISTIYLYVLYISAYLKLFMFANVINFNSIYFIFYSALQFHDIHTPWGCTKQYLSTTKILCIFNLCHIHIVLMESKVQHKTKVLNEMKCNAGRTKWFCFYFKYSKVLKEFSV